MGGGRPESPGYSGLASGGTGDLGNFKDLLKVYVGPSVGIQIHSAGGRGPLL